VASTDATRCRQDGRASPFAAKIASGLPTCRSDDDADRGRVGGGEVCGDGGGHAGPEGGPRSGLYGLAAGRWTQMTTSAASSMPSVVREPGRHGGVAVLGDDVAGSEVGPARVRISDSDQGPAGIWISSRACPVSHSSRRLCGQGRVGGPAQGLLPTSEAQERPAGGLLAHWQSRGRGFESPQLHPLSPGVLPGFMI
jgi:hypothetical protein